MFTSFYLLVGLLALAALLSMQMAIISEHSERSQAERNKRTIEQLTKDNDKEHGIFNSIKRFSRELRNSFVGGSSTNPDEGRGGSTAIRALQREAREQGWSADDNDNNDDGNGNTEFLNEDVSFGTTGSGVNQNGLIRMHQHTHLTVDQSQGPPVSESASGDRDQNKQRQYSQCSVRTKAKQETETFAQIMMYQWDEEIESIRQTAIFNFCVIWIIIALGVASMMGLESWNSETAFYWACQTVTTVGYGDVSADTDGGKLFTCVYIVVGVGYVAKAIADIVKYPLVLRTRHVEEKVLHQFAGDLSDNMLQKIFHNEFYIRHPSLQQQPSEMTKMEFIVLVLEMMNKIEEKDLMLVSKIFDRLDANGDGTLNADDMEALRRTAQERDNLQRAEEEKEQEKIKQDLMVGRSTASGLTGHLSVIWEIMRGSRYDESESFSASHFNRSKRESDFDFDKIDEVADLSSAEEHLLNLNENNNQNNVESNVISGGEETLALPLK